MTPIKFKSIVFTCWSNFALVPILGLGVLVATGCLGVQTVEKDLQNLVIPSKTIRFSISDDGELPPYTEDSVLSFVSRTKEMNEGSQLRSHSKIEPPRLFQIKLNDSRERSVAAEESKVLVPKPVVEPYRSDRLSGIRQTSPKLSMKKNILTQPAKLITATKSQSFESEGKGKSSLPSTKRMAAKKRDTLSSAKSETVASSKLVKMPAENGSADEKTRNAQAENKSHRKVLPVIKAGFFNTNFLKKKKDPRAMARDLDFARSLELEGKVDSAMNKYEDLLNQGCDEPLLYHRMAVIHDTHGRYSEAVLLYQKAVQLDPENEELLCDLGFRWFLLKEYRLAEKYFRQSLGVNNYHTRTHNNIAILYSRLNNRKMAMKHFQLAGLSVEDSQNNFEISRQDQQY